MSYNSLGRPLIIVIVFFFPFFLFDITFCNQGNKGLPSHTHTHRGCVCYEIWIYVIGCGYRGKWCLKIWRNNLLRLWEAFSGAMQSSGLIQLTNPGTNTNQLFHSYYFLLWIILVCTFPFFNIWCQIWLNQWLYRMRVLLNAVFACINWYKRINK